MLLVTNITRLFTKNTVKVWSQAQPLFKDYYSRRLTLSPQELERFLMKLSVKKFSEFDHRWISLLQNIQSLLPKFPLNSKIYMFKALAGMGSKSELTQKLHESIVMEVNQLTFEEAAILLWCLSKCGGAHKIQDVTKIYRHMCSIFANYESEEGLTIIISKEDNKQLEQQVLALKSTSICMVLSAMASLGISQKTVLKHLLRSGVRPNIAAFSTNGLVTLLISLDRLGFRNKKDSLSICLQIRKRYQQLELGPLETIKNLTWGVSSLLVSKHFDEVEYDGTNKSQESIEKVRIIRDDLKRFVLWLCETIMIREQPLDKEVAAKIVHACAKAEVFYYEIWAKALNVLCLGIEDCKIIDLVMALKALTKLNETERKMLSKEEEIISKRLWILHSSISGKSLQILSQLYSIKKINPPPKICEILAQSMIKQAPLKKENENTNGYKK